MALHPLCLLSATRLASWIREGRVTSTQAVQVHINRLKQVNPRLNAMVENRFAQALKQAAAADRHLATADVAALPPLFGVPCSIKECFAVDGMVNTGGLYARRGMRATGNATTVQRLVDAGAIIMGTTNVSELCMWMETDNCIYGRTNNPYDLRRTVGGSSGGEAALVATGAAPFGLGSDLGGSIRMPAFFNGIFGHKPTGGLVPNTGQFPLLSGSGYRTLVTGPFARRAEDLMPLMRILSGPDEAEGDIWPDALKDPAQVDISALRILVVPDNGRIPVDRDVSSALQTAAQALRSRGATVTTMRFDRLKHAFEMWSASLHAAQGPSFRERMGNGRHLNPYAELARWFARGSRHTLPAIGLGILESIGDLLPGQEKKYLQMAHEFRHELDDALGDDGIILHPPYPTAAPLHGKPLLPPFNWIYTAVFNPLHLPITQVPVGATRRGLPMGVQVIGPRGRDYLPIAVALNLEKACGGWHPPARFSGTDPA